MTIDQLTKDQWAEIMPDVAKALLGDPNPRLSKGELAGYREKEK